MLSVTDNSRGASGDRLYLVIPSRNSEAYQETICRDRHWTGLQACCQIIIRERRNRLVFVSTERPCF
jgi:hypothetical protein